MRALRARDDAHALAGERMLVGEGVEMMGQILRLPFGGGIAACGLRHGANPSECDLFAGIGERAAACERARAGRGRKPEDRSNALWIEADAGAEDEQLRLPRAHGI